MRTEFPEDWRVRVLMRSRPVQMVHDLAAQVLGEHRMDADDLAWILASYELRKPRVIERTVSEAVQTKESFG